MAFAAVHIPGLWLGGKKVDGERKKEVKFIQKNLSSSALKSSGVLEALVHEMKKRHVGKLT